MRHVCDLVGMDRRPCRQLSLSHSVIANGSAASADKLLCQLSRQRNSMATFRRSAYFRRDLSGRLLHQVIFQKMQIVVQKNALSNHSSALLRSCFGITSERIGNSSLDRVWALHRESGASLTGALRFAYGNACGHEYDGLTL